MPKRRYSAADIVVLTLTEAVRKRPGMYFGVGQGDPRLATRALSTVVGGAFHPPPRLADVHTPHVVVDVTADLAFTVTDDLADPELGDEESLLVRSRWSSAVTAAVCSRTVVEVWRDGRGLRQTLVGSDPVEPRQSFAPPVGSGGRVSFDLDPDFFGPATITADFADLDLHGPDCFDADGPGEVLIRDRRGASGVAEYRFT